MIIRPYPCIGAGNGESTLDVRPSASLDTSFVPGFNRILGSCTAV